MSVSPTCPPLPTHGPHLGLALSSLPSPCPSLLPSLPAPRVTPSNGSQRKIQSLIKPPPAQNPSMVPGKSSLLSMVSQCDLALGSSCSLISPRPFPCSVKSATWNLFQFLQYARPSIALPGLCLCPCSLPKSLPSPTWSGSFLLILLLSGQTSPPTEVLPLSGWGRHLPALESSNPVAFLHVRLTPSGLCFLYPSPDFSGVSPSGDISVCSHWIISPFKAEWSSLVTTVSPVPRIGPEHSG